MKKLHIIEISVVFTILLGFGSCQYLDVVPDNIATIDNAFTDRTNAEKYLYTCYSYRPPIGAVDLDPAMSGCDETWRLALLVASSGVSTWPNSKIARGFQTATAPLFNFWDGQDYGKPLWIGIRDCNIFLENADKVKGLSASEKKRWIAEVKFLKAYYHYYMFKCYGPIPIIDVNLPIDADIESIKVYRQPVDDVVKYIADLMLEASADLPNKVQVVEGLEAGRIDKQAALSMRAEVLLFAASPLFNGNTDYAGMIDKRGISLFPQSYDPNKWKIAADACKEAIDACHEQNIQLYNLVDPLLANSADVFKLQTTYREAICARWNKELIWGGTNNNMQYLCSMAEPKLCRIQPQAEGNSRAEWAPTMKIVEKYYSSNGVPIDEDIQWQSNDWYKDRFKVRSEASKGDEIYYIKEGKKTANLHFNREPRFYASIGFDKGIYYGMGFYDFNTDVKYTDFFAKAISGKNSSEGYSITGYVTKKMNSFKNSQTSSSSTYEYYPFPILRLADLYLMYAEALNEDSGPSAEVYSYLDLIRERAGLKGVKESWSNYSTNSGKPDSKEGLREIIHQERTIELAFEGKRFWDIRRWKEIDVLNDQPRGWNAEGENTESFYQVTLVAYQPVVATIKDYFWPISEGDLIANNNLIQNYGW